MFSKTQFRIFGYIHGDHFIPNVLLFNNPVEVDRVVCCNIWAWEVKESHEKFRVIDDVEPIFGEVVKEDKRHLFPLSHSKKYGEYKGEHYHGPQRQTYLVR